ncbi:hypothetical protein H6503_03110 [Candidatus Woesearchaeota archaeon]|nr:hypothetical protein [Candidatus Woesearchaeota archaeon]
MRYKRYGKRPLRHALAAPFIWGVSIPLIVLDICAEIYHQVAFRLYGLDLVKRSDYIRIDRHRLKYLGFFDKLNCVYCGYANGVAAYFVEIAARTEEYWCGIKHAHYMGFKEPKHHKNFARYGDKCDLEKKYPLKKNQKLKN